MRISDWSSDVCSSDLGHPQGYATGPDGGRGETVPAPWRDPRTLVHGRAAGKHRSGDRAHVRIHPRPEADQPRNRSGGLHLHSAPARKPPAIGPTTAKISNQSKRERRGKAGKVRVVAA